MARGSVIVACVVLSMASACKKHNGGKGVGGGGGGEHGDVELIVDGKVVASANKDAVKWTPVADLLPAAAKDTKSWHALEVHTAAGRVTTMGDPAATQPGMIPALFPGDDGVDFGMFSADALAKHGAPTSVEHHITDVRVALAAPDPNGAGSASGSDGSGANGGSGSGNGEGNGSNRTASADGPDVSNVKLTIKQKAGDLEVSGNDLLKIAKTTAPIGDTTTEGWDVAAVLASRQIKPTAKVVITDESGTSVTMTAKQFDPKTDLAFMKINKQGQIRFRLFEKNPGGAWDVAGELRGVTTIELLP